MVVIPIVIKLFSSPEGVLVWARSETSPGVGVPSAGRPAGRASLAGGPAGPAAVGAGEGLSPAPLPSENGTWIDPPILSLLWLHGNRTVDSLPEYAQWFGG